MSDTGNLNLLGQGATKYPTRPEDAVLETFDNQHTENDYVVEFEVPEFTSLCPKTGQPDFARLSIVYIPDLKMIESKALKLFLFSFRNCGEFHEDVTNQIARRLYDVMKPKVLIVRGDFYPRGGISINPTVILPNMPDHELYMRILNHWRLTANHAHGPVTI